MLVRCREPASSNTAGIRVVSRNIRQRAEALINIAAPEFREELIKEAEKMGIWTNTSKTSY